MNDSFLIEGYIFNTLSPEDKLIVDARLITDQSFADKFDAQKTAYMVITEYSRRQLRCEISRIETCIFTDKKYTSFRKTINKLFKL